MLTAPVLIVGAGPAGCSASVFLSKAGIPHVIIDKADFPRDKVCGDAVSGNSMYVLRAAGADWVDDLWQSKESVLQAPGLTFVAPNGKSLAVAISDKEGRPSGFTAPRLFFDNFLFRRLDKTFATVHTGSTLESLSREGEGWLVAIHTPGGTQELRTKLVIAADGDKGVVRKLLGLRESDLKSTAVGLRAYYSGVTFPEDGSGNIELHFLPELLPGYLWIFPMAGGLANVGVGMPGKDVRDRKLNLRERMLDAIAHNDTLSARFGAAKPEGKILGWGLPMGTERRSVCGDAYMLTGDAAQLIDPFSGEGIGNALYSGMKAAKAAVAALADGDYTAPALKRLYEDPLYKGIWSELQISGLLQRLSRYPWIMNFIIGKAARSATLKTTISGMFTDLDLRSKLRQPLFYLRILFNR